MVFRIFIYIYTWLLQGLIKTTQGKKYIYNNSFETKGQITLIRFSPTEMASRENYCYAHNIIFDSPELYEEHQLTCVSQYEQPRLCKQHDDNGSMCGLVCKDLEKLRVHALEDHNVHICVVCDAQSISPLVGHHHKDAEKSIHSG